jgi:hypothetical protein
MALRDTADHTYGTEYRHKDDDMIETPPSVPFTGIRMFARPDGASVQCIVAQNELELVIVTFDDGQRFEIEPSFVDVEMLREGLGEIQMPEIH